MKSSALFYCIFCIVVISYTVFGLDWQPATLSAMPDADVTAYVAPVPPPKPVVVVAAPPDAAPVAPPPAATPAAPKQAAPAPRVAPVIPPVAETPKPLCDVAACAAAYRSFRESDCTYNPSFGDRKLCTKGVVPTAAPVAPAVPAPAAQTPAPVAQTPAPPAPDGQPPSIANAEPGTQPPAGAPSDLKCNVGACAAAYRSFRESDCTFNPSFGPRQVCKK